MQSLLEIFAIKNLIPHGYCLSWNPALLWLHVSSDLLIMLAYFSIPLMLVYFIRQRKDLPYAWLIIMVSGFVLACGTTHLLSAIMIWLPLYWLDGWIKALTAIIALATAVQMLRVIPLALALPSSKQLQAEIDQKELLTKALHKSESRYHTLFNLNDDAIMLWNKEGFFDCNSATLALFGCATQEEFYTKHPADLSPKQQLCNTSSVILANQHIARALEESSDRFEWVHQRTDTGATFLAEVKLDAFVIDGEAMLQAVVRDITAQKAAEKIISASAKYNRCLIEASLDSLLTISAEGVISDVNAATESVTGLGRDQLIGSDFSDYFTEPDKAKAGCRQIFAEGFVVDYPLAFRHRSGKVTDVLYNASIYRDDSGGIAGAFAAARDISSRRKADQILMQIKSLIDVAMDGFLIVDLMGNLLQVNETYVKMSGYSHAELECMHISQLDVTKDQEQVKAHIEYIVQQGSGRFETQHRHKDGRIIDLDASVAYTPELKLFCGFYRDITERKKTEKELRLAATIFESKLGMLVTDANKIILRINKAFTNITGYTAEEVIGKEVAGLLKSDRHNVEFYTAMLQKLDRTGQWAGEIWHRRKNGEHFPDYLTIAAAYDLDGQLSYYASTFEDITVRRAVADQIEHLAFYDPLTNLPNRQLLQDRLRPALAASYRNGRKGALLFIDLDNFKILNDTLGHDMGDLLLQQVAQRLLSTLRENDTVARLGGDEFVLLLQDLSGDDLKAAAQIEIVGNKVLAALNQPYQLASHIYHSTPSIGATLFNGHDHAIAEIMKQADIAMYQAKDAGRNALRFFDAQMQEAINASAAMEVDLRVALIEQQFELFYQPQVDHTGQIIGAEALIRWQHPQLGWVSPAEFIPLAETSCLIVSIGEWVLDKACAQLKAWETSQHTLHLRLAVNVSAKQFHQPDFVELVSQLLYRSAINPDKLKLELTETIVLDNVDDTLIKMIALKKMGVRFSMDDFGTGQSSLSILKKLPFDQLKIDQSFVRDISIDPDDQVIVKTIIQMAINLGMEVIAEGVETEAQRAFLKNNDCPHYQGYLFSKPVPIGQFEALLKGIATADS